MNIRFIRDPHLILKRVGDCFIAYNERSGETVVLHDVAFQTLGILNTPMSFDSALSLLDLTNLHYESEQEIVDFVGSVFDEMLKRRFIHEVAQ